MELTVEKEISTETMLGEMDGLVQLIRNEVGDAGQNLGYLNNVDDETRKKIAEVLYRHFKACATEARMLSTTMRRVVAGIYQAKEAKRRQTMVNVIDSGWLDSLES